MDDALKRRSSEFLARRHELMAFIYGLVRKPHAAEDIFQEVWLRLADAAEKGREIRDTARWCRGVARNLVLHHWRDRRNAKVVVDSEMVDLVGRAFDEQDEAHDYWQERRRALHGCMEKLPEQSRRVLELKYFRGFSARDVGTRLKRSAEAVLMALSRIRRTLSECAEQVLRSKGVQA